MVIFTSTWMNNSRSTEPESHLNRFNHDDKYDTRGNEEDDSTSVRL